MKIIIILVLVTFVETITIPLAAQSPVAPQLTVHRTETPIRIDGELNETAWSETESASPFLNKWPLDTGIAIQQTQVKMLFNNSYLYVSVINFQKRKDVVIQTLKRDQLQSFWNSDGFSIVLDPMGQRSTAFLFGVNAGGAQIEGAITAIGSWASMNENWDNKWFSAVSIHDDYWVAELAIPFTALRFKNTSEPWGLNFIRNDMKHNTFSTWSNVPLRFNGMDLGHLGTLVWDGSVTPNKSKATLIPYASGGPSKNHEDNENLTTNANAGMDMKLALTSSMNLDLTYKPDFSNVEVDRQMTNVTRYSLLFPERRNFFLENADLFSNFGSWMTNPFFSRRIGLSDGKPVPIMGGARLSGNLTKGLRIGVMDIQTEPTDELSANNYLVTAAQQQVLSRSSVKFFGANRQTTRTTDDDATQDYNRSYGGEFQYISKDGKWNGYLRAHSAFTPDKMNENDYVSTQVNYLTSKLYAGGILERIGENYVNDLGFIPRLYNYDALRDTTVRIGHHTFNPWFGLLIYPKKSKLINMIEPNTWSVVAWRNSGEFLERNTSMNLNISFKDTRSLYFEAFNTDVNLPFASDILDNDNPIPVGRYNFTHYSVKYTTDSRKPFSGSASIGRGDFYNGVRTEIGGSINYRVQPWGLFAINFLQNDIRLGGDSGSAVFQLIGPRAEISLRNNVWWTTFLQYNTQQDNFNVNSRFQWRYKPMSDLFIVYTDNYIASNMNVKDRSLVIKLTYWLNL
jgi:hypothetical protein